MTMIPDSENNKKCSRALGAGRTQTLHMTRRSRFYSNDEAGDSMSLMAMTATAVTLMNLCRKLAEKQLSNNLGIAVRFLA